MHTRKIIFFTIISFLFSFNTIEFNKKNHIEKIYTQTDRPLYFPGETIWFKSYITNAENKISTISEVLYAELISPKGTVANDIKLSINQGYAYGDFQIDDDWVGGIYKLRMYTHWMKNYGKESYFEKEIVVQKVISPNLLMTLKFDKKAYGKSSEVRAHFEAKDLKNIPKSDQEIKFEVKINGSTFLSEITNTDNKGKKDIVFKLPDSLNTTDVLLTVLVPHKSSRESISRSVPVTLNNIDLQFFPESGNAIIGIENQIAFKAINEFGKPADISGEILDTKGQVITKFQSYHDGMGSFLLTPKTENYYARITQPFRSDSLILLPKAQPFGTKFSVVEKNDNYIIYIYTTLNEALKLGVSNSYKELFTKNVKISEHTAVLKLNKEGLPTGILKISLYDTNNNIVAERLIFANQSNKLNIAISLDKEIYKTREKVKVKIKTTDKFNVPIPSNLSLSIADNKLVSFADDKQDNIYSYLLLSSELKGKIYKPAFYFDAKEKKAKTALNYVMLTHGWRNYLNTNSVTLSNAIYQPDSKATQYGKVVDKNYKAVKAHLLLFDPFSDEVLKFDTNNKGEFSFTINQSRNLVLLAYTDDGKNLNIIKERFVHSSIHKNSYKANGKNKFSEFKPLDINKPLTKKVKEKVLSSNKLGIKLSGDNALDEVVVIGYGIQKRRALSGAVATVVEDNTISTLNIDNLGQLLQGRVAGVNITNNSGLSGSSSNILIRGANSISGNSQPLIIIDGIPFNQNSKAQGALYNLEPSTVENIHVLKGAAASSLYGSNGINGVIIITTKNQNFNRLYGSKSLNNKKFRNYTAQTFYRYSSLRTYNSKQFYTPVYESEELPKDRNDFRQTIYWNPVIQTDKNGEASFEYYNSDAITSFIITTEGVGFNGLIGRNETRYATKKLLNIDFKTPNYMALNDTTKLPLVITNDSDELINAKLKLELPKELKLLKRYDNATFSIEPNSHQILSITVLPIKKSKRTSIKVSAISNHYSDRINRDVTIISPFFPTQASISGYKNDTYQFNVNNVVDGSLKAEFSIYTDIAGDVMDGIEGMIREPYGCFEQVSSTTYPNILVLKYLKETGKSNPVIEKKAIAFIKKGYKKLAAYETSKNGFEWYGHTPPHEVLSAYGLMEFMEMKEVYDKVSEPMIQRTIKYLMSRKNGKGGFKQHRGKYGFSAAPINVNNAYIVYALSESGIKVNIEDEYNFAYNEALKSNDSYRMALMACASMNLKKTENTRIIMNKIKENIATYGFQKLPVENTITRSYGNAKAIETAAFNILALLKEGNSEFMVRQGIEYILSKRTSGRFGSTQSTSMALKALIAYTKTQKQKILTQNSAVEIQINGTKIMTALKLNNDGKIVIENLEKYIKEGPQNIKVSYSNSEMTFPYLLNVEWDSTVPTSSSECKLELKTEIPDVIQSIGQNMRMNIFVKNKTNKPLPMATAIIGIPSGTSAQSWQLKEILEKNKADYYEIFDNYLVFYWKEFDASEVKVIQLDLKAEISGSYQAPASTVYLYYADDFKYWIKGNKVRIE